LAPVAEHPILQPNNKMQPVTVTANADDNSGLPMELSATVACNECKKGDWTAPEVDQDSGEITLKVNAAKDCVYTIPVTAVDEAGNVASADVKVEVSPRQLGQ